MNILLLGKTGGITHWVEDVAADIRIAGHTVAIVPTRNPRLSKSLEQALLSPAIGAPLARWMVRQLRRLSPDLVLAVGALDQFPRIIFEHLARVANRPPLIAWIGDVFTEQAAGIADLFDIVAYTDTGLLALHNRFGFRSTGAFVALGATRAVRPSGATVARITDLAFVAGVTPNRRELLADVTEPIAIFGPGWQHAHGLAHHKRDARRIDEWELADIYARHIAILNIRNERYVINGLNQRHFAPYIHGTPVVSDAQADIPHCFDPGTEILVYRDAAELNDLYAALRRDRQRATAIGLAGQRRVLAHHTYAHRLDTIAALAGITTARTH
jgi:spore maturation protein CgeB